MTRTDVINTIIRHYNYNSYLEIGVRNPRDNFNLVNCGVKYGVDPKTIVGHNGNHMWKKTSDELFAYLPDKFTFNLIFIDGGHTETQAKSDICNSLRHITENGTIVLHDCNPVTEELQWPIKKGMGNWSGQVWKAFVSFRDNIHLNMFTVDCDFGIGVIQKKGQQSAFGLPPGIDRTYQWFAKIRKEILNLIPANEKEIKRRLICLL